jgi:LAS superfamily LD-carboxypeptidase LdcB
MMALIGGCSVPTEQAPEETIIGFDLGEPTENLGKADGACRNYPGGDLNGDDLLVLVNKTADQQLASDWAPRDLVRLPAHLRMPGRDCDLRGPVAGALSSMLAAAADVDIELGVRSAYRSFSTQCMTFDYKVREHGLEHAKRFSAEPGRSQHQLGTTVDISGGALSWALSQDMGGTIEGQWLAENAHQFGFALSYPKGHEEETGYAYEPWHYRYIGVEAAQEMNAAGLILEAYLRRCLAGDSALSCAREVFPEPIANDGFIGGTCTSDTDCSGVGDGAFCLRDGYSGGYCTLACEQYCPDQAGYNTPTFCVGQSDAPGGLCHSQCDTTIFPDSGCRAGYTCALGSRPNGSKSADVCVPE